MSKAIKSSIRERSRLYLWWIDTELANIWYKFLHKYIENPRYQVIKLWDWYWNVFKNDYDFDAFSIFFILSYKLKRVEQELLIGYAVQDPKDLKALRIAIKLASRLSKDEYTERAHRKHDAKWGELASWFEPCNDGTDNSFWRSSRPNANTDVLKLEERADVRAMYFLEDVLRKRDERWLYYILQNHLRLWWS